RIDGGLRCTATGRLPGAGVGAVEQVGQPSVLTASACRRDRRGFGAARGRPTEVRRRERRRAACVAHAYLVAALAADIGCGCHQGLFLALYAGAARRHDIEAAAMMGDDPVELGERLDLVDDHL